MQTVGGILKQRRLKLRKNLLQIQSQTKISLQNLRALENNNFARLPPETFVKGFIRNYALAVNLKPEKLIAIFRRDKSKKEKINIIPAEIDPKKVNRSFWWTPKMTLVLVMGLGTILFLTYLGLQVKKYFSPPPLTIFNLAEENQTFKNELEIKGQTGKEATVYINNQLVNTDDKGNFAYQLQLAPGENKIEVKAVDQRQKQSILIRKITVVDKGD
jgi:cytoskeletal protein RodZ